jgi:hypothetical protein
MVSRIWLRATLDVVVRKSEGDAEVMRCYLETITNQQTAIRAPLLLGPKAAVERIPKRVRTVYALTSCCNAHEIRQYGDPVNGVNNARIFPAS